MRDGGGWIGCFGALDKTPTTRVNALKGCVRLWDMDQQLDFFARGLLRRIVVQRSLLGSLSLSFVMVLLYRAI